MLSRRLSLPLRTHRFALPWQGRYHLLKFSTDRKRQVFGRYLRAAKTGGPVSTLAGVPTFYTIEPPDRLTNFPLPSPPWQNSASVEASIRSMPATF